MKTKLHYLFIALALFAGVHPALAQTTPLSIAQAGNQVVLSWPAAATNCFLQSTTNLSPTAWSNVSAAPVVISGQFTVTNSISGTQQFYQLSQTTMIPGGMALIPVGSFTMGDIADTNLSGDAAPISVTVSAFYMDTNPVSYSQWQTVYNWTTTNGYSFDYAGSGKTANNPVQTVDWYDVVKWSNARSEMAGLTPCYYTDATQTTVYRTGQNDLQASFVDWGASGYRLPTEAEWEKAARGGLSGQRFPWGGTISESQANYYGDTGGYSYDLGPNGYNAIGNFPATSPGTSPVGSFAANGYGLYDMAGNVLEWCWDWYAAPPYPTGSPYLGGSDPRGAASDDEFDDGRILRGGAWALRPYSSRCAARNSSDPLSGGSYYVGFRCVRGL